MYRFYLLKLLYLILHDLVVLWMEIFLFFCCTHIYSFFATFCTVLSALDLARDHAPQKWPLLSLLVLINSLKSSTTVCLYLDTEGFMMYYFLYIYIYI